MEGIAIYVGAENANNEASFHTRRDARPNEPKNRIQIHATGAKASISWHFHLLPVLLPTVQSHMSHDHCMDTRLLFVLTSPLVGQDVDRKGLSFHGHTLPALCYHVTNLKKTKVGINECSLVHRVYG